MSVPRLSSQYMHRCTPNAIFCNSPRTCFFGVAAAAGKAVIFTVDQ